MFTRSQFIAIKSICGWLRQLKKQTKNKRQQYTKLKLYQLATNCQITGACFTLVPLCDVKRQLPKLFQINHHSDWFSLCAQLLRRSWLPNCWEWHCLARTVPYLEECVHLRFPGVSHGCCNVAHLARPFISSVLSWLLDSATVCLCVCVINSKLASLHTIGIFTSYN